jgi:hypothetical protein
MEKIFITVVVLYALFVALCLFRLKLEKKRRKDIVGKGSSIDKTGNLKTDIIGKSKFDGARSMPLATKSTPLAATLPENEKGIENPDTFVPSNEVKPPAEVPPEEPDKVFSDTPPEDETELPDIDYPLECEPDETAGTDDGGRRNGRSRRHGTGRTDIRC